MQAERKESRVTGFQLVWLSRGSIQQDWQHSRRTSLADQAGRQLSAGDWRASNQKYPCVRRGLVCCKNYAGGASHEWSPPRRWQTWKIGRLEQNLGQPTFKGRTNVEGSAKVIYGEGGLRLEAGYKFPGELWGMRNGIDEESKKGLQVGWKTLLR